jgi:excisionase family DNA binding protein
MSERLLTAEQVAELLGRTTQWVYTKSVYSDLPTVRLGGLRRFRQEQVEAWYARHGEGRSKSAVADVIAQAKKDQPCSDCGRSDLPPEQMHFHHVHPATKTKKVRQASSPDSARREIAKCVLLCPDCHYQRHREMAKWAPVWAPGA